MTVTVNFTTVTNSIAALSVSGVTIADIHDISESQTMKPLHLAPRPDGFISDVAIGWQTFGSGSTRTLELSYTLTYRYYHCEIAGGLGSIFDSYSGMITNIAAILVAILTNDAITGCVDIAVAGIGELGPVSDNSGNAFHGCDLAFRITEYVNA